MTRDLWLLILGSILGFGGGLAAFFIQWWWNERSRQKVLMDFLKEIFRAFERVSPRIIETYEKSGVLWNDLLNQVASDLALYERNKEHSIVLKDISLRAEIWDYFSQLRTVVNVSLGLNAILNRDPENPWAKEDVKKQVERIKELKTEAHRLMGKLK